MKRALLLEPVPPNFDLSSCETWGEVVIMFPAGFPYPAHDSRFESLLLDKLAELRINGQDAFIVAGKLSKVARAISVCDPCTLLIYVERTQSYKSC